MFCTKCGIAIEKSSKFCHRCSKTYPPLSLFDNTNDDDVRYVKTSMKSYIPTSLSRIPSLSTCGSSVSTDVRAAKAKATLQSYTSSKDV